MGLHLVRPQWDTCALLPDKTSALILNRPLDSSLVLSLRSYNHIYFAPWTFNSVPYNLKQTVDSTNNGLPKGHPEGMETTKSQLYGPLTPYRKDPHFRFWRQSWHGASPASHTRTLTPHALHHQMSAHPLLLTFQLKHRFHTQLE